ncbi:MAG: glycosyltransferase family 39 protein [Bacteroidetes bacterium]|nr:glycosyltransferase family 39 protein [Bacteroidota bacterium]
MLLSTLYNRSYLFALFLFAIFLFIGISTYQDYGISWDETSQREIGLTSYRYIFEGDHTLDNYIERDHGVGFELPLIMIERALRLSDSREIYLMRHIVSHIFFLFGCLCAFFLAQRRFQRIWISCLAFLMLAMHPRLYAHSFFNSKDIPLLVMFMVSLLLWDMVLERKKTSWVLILGVAVGYTMSIRLLGIVLVAGISFFLLLNAIQARFQKSTTKSTSPLHWLGILFIFLLTSSLSLYAFFPTLWAHPFHSIVACFESLSHFRWESNVWFQGVWILSFQLPASYLPVWIGITTPVLWLLLGCIGIGMVIVSAIFYPYQSWLNLDQQQTLLWLFCTLAPIVAVIVQHSVVYDDWRHVYFIYPSFIMLACLAIHRLSKKKLAPIIATYLCLQIGFLARHIISLHPFEQVYFNRLVSHDNEYLRYHYELEYWGTSCFQGLEYLIAHAPQREIKIAWGKDPLNNNVNMLQKQDRDRIQFVDEKDADYYVTFFRDHPEDYHYSNIFYEIKREGSTILRIYALH